MEKNQSQTAKTRIYNLIILDKSGSMTGIRTAAYEGCNEVINGIRAAAEKHADTQEQFISLLLFDSQSMPYIFRCMPASQTEALHDKDYVPCACTPLLDAVGMALTDLKKEVDKYEDAVGMVTIITDGYENSSTEYTYPQIQKMIGDLKNKGWNFSFMGANQDVKQVCVNLNINIGNAREFSFDDAGMRETWRLDREAKERYYCRMETVKARRGRCSKEELEHAYAKMNLSCSYFEEPTTEQPRITPEKISHLKKNEIFVFGSNAQGHHGGGAAALAMQRFGAIWGQGEGLQGQSYAIPTMGGLQETEAAVKRFIDFARQHSELRFMVTAIGCGIAGYTPEQIAPMFREATSLTNVYLPQSFLNVIARQ